MIMCMVITILMIISWIIILFMYCVMNVHVRARFRSSLVMLICFVNSSSTTFACFG